MLPEGYESQWEKSSDGKTMRRKRYSKMTGEPYYEYVKTN